MYLIENGTVEILNEDDGTTRICKTLSKGDTFAEFALFDPSKQASVARAKTVCNLWFLHKRMFQSVAAEIPLDVMSRLRRVALCMEKSHSKAHSLKVSTKLSKIFNHDAEEEEDLDAGNRKGGGLSAFRS